MISPDRLLVAEIEDKAVLDAAIVANSRAVEHCEMSRDGTLIAWTEELGHDDVVRSIRCLARMRSTKQKRPRLVRGLFFRDRFSAGFGRAIAQCLTGAGELFGCLVGHNGEVLGLLAVPDFAKSLGSHAALEQFPYRRGPARHSPCKTPSIDDPQFLVRKHDLEPLASAEFTHKYSLLERNNPIISSLLFILINLVFGVWQLELQRCPIHM
jgi:Domain of unknown function (DUF892)